MFLLTVAATGGQGRNMTKPSNPALVPWPASVALSVSERFAITKETAIETSAGQADLQRIAKDLADLLRPALDGTPTIRDASNQVAPNAIRLEISQSAQQNSDEGYDLTIASTGVRIVGASAAGVFYGVQTLRQLLPWSVELRGARPHAIAVATGHIVDRPRFVWRGAMLDVARHFYGPRDVKRYIDLLASYKFNRLHLHLSDDQGWRIEIAAWPNLTAHGGSTAVGGGSGGFYTKQDYADLVAYARDRFITIVPEIDMPSHINAALVVVPGVELQRRRAAALHGHRRRLQQFLSSRRTSLTSSSTTSWREICGHDARHRTSTSAATRSRS